jgi:large subunit ribosomal protein L20
MNFASNFMRKCVAQMRTTPFGQQMREMANLRHKKLIKLAKGYTGRTNCYTVALQRVTKARQYAYIGRKLKKRNMRRLWIQRINAGSRMYGVRYNDVIHKMVGSQVILNRAVLSELAVSEPLSFKSVIEVINVVSKKARHARKASKRMMLTQAAAEAAVEDVTSALQAQSLSDNQSQSQSSA